MTTESLLSGRFGEPEGGRLLSNKEKAALENLVKHETVLNEIIVEFQTGGEADVWARVQADGTKITGSTSVTLTASREDPGVYLITSSQTAGSSGGNFLFGVLVSVSAKAGNGGDGVSPFLGFSSYQVVATDNTANLNWFWNDNNDKIYLIGPDQDDAYVHLTGSNFTTAPTQVAYSSTVRTGTRQSGVLSNDGAYLWKSGDSAVPVEAMATSNNAVTTFGNLDLVILAADSTSIYGLNGGTLKKYTPNFGGASLGGSVTSWAFDPGVVIGMWDEEGYLWTSSGNAGLYQVDPSGSDFTEYDFPQIPDAVSAESSASTPCYDRLRRKIYVTLNDSSSQHWLYEFSGWTFGENHSGTWQQIARLPDGTTGISYNSDAGILLSTNTGGLTVTRWSGDPLRPIDTVSVDDETPDNPEVDYDLSGSWFSRWEGDSAYVQGSKGGQEYLIRIIYAGDPLDFGGGRSAVSSVLVPMYEITSATEAYVYIFRSLSPPVYADGEFTVEFKYPES